MSTFVILGLKESQIKCPLERITLQMSSYLKHIKETAEKFGPLFRATCVCIVACEI